MYKKFVSIVPFLVYMFIADSLFSLLYFYVAILSYTVWLPAYSFSSFLALILAAQRLYHGPGPLEICILGFFSPLLSLFPFIPLLLRRTKVPSWAKVCLFLIWLGEIFVLGWLTPHLPI